MEKIIRIQASPNYNLICEYKDGSLKSIDVNKLIEKHNHLNGINKLKDFDVFKQAKIGDLGQIYWSNIYTNKDGEQFDYDISPEFIWNYKE